MAELNFVLHTHTHTKAHARERQVCVCVCMCVICLYVCVKTSHCFHPSVDRHLGRSCMLSVVNNAIINVQVFLWGVDLELFRYMLRSSLG